MLVLCFILAQDGSLGTRHLHALTKRPCTKTGRLRVALVRAPFFLLGPATPEIGFMMVSILYYRFFLGLCRPNIIGPCMAIIFYYEPSGYVEEPPRLIWQSTSP